MKPARSNHGFSMVEVAMALGLVSFAFVSIVSILPLGLSDTRNAVAGTEAGCVLAAVSADLLAAPLGATQTPRFQILLPNASNLSVGSLATLYTGETGSNRDRNGTLITLPGNAKFKAVVSFQPRSANQKISIPVRISVSWPAAAAANATASTLETVIALNR